MSYDDDEMRNKAAMAQLIRYRQQKDNARRRKIYFLLSFEEWKDIWEQSGHWEERGRGIEQYCMSRIGDIGPYEVGNVFIQLRTDNSNDATKGKPSTNKNRKVSEETKEKQHKIQSILHSTPEYKKEQSIRMQMWWNKRRGIL